MLHDTESSAAVAIAEEEQPLFFDEPEFAALPKKDDGEGGQRAELKRKRD